MIKSLTIFALCAVCMYRQDLQKYNWRKVYIDLKNWMPVWDKHNKDIDSRFKTCF